MGATVSISPRIAAFLFRLLRRGAPKSKNEDKVRFVNNHTIMESYQMDLCGVVTSDDQLHSVLYKCSQPDIVDSLTVCNTNITKVPTAIGRFENLENLVLKNNHIINITWAIVYLKNLKSLDLSYNLLTEIPRVIGHLTKLEVLKLQGNHLRRLPLELLNLELLRELDVSKNYKLFRPFEAPLASDKNAIFTMLRRRLTRNDLWEKCTPWVDEENQMLNKKHRVLSLHERCVQCIIQYKLDFLSPRYVPPVVKNNLVKVEEEYKSSLALAKCSNCKKYFSTKEIYDNHLC